MTNWSALPDGVIVLIGRNLQHIEDFSAFRGTCNSWRLATTLKDFDRSYPKLPLLILNTTERMGMRKYRMKVSDEREVFSIYKNKISRIYLPEAKGKKCIGSKGWLITFGSSFDMSLLNPITRSQIPLPHAPLQLGAHDDVNESHRMFLKAVLSANPSETSDYVVMVVFKESCNASPTYIGLWKPNECTWTRVETPVQPYGYAEVLDVTYYNGKLYALLMCKWDQQQVGVCDLLGPNPKRVSKIIELHKSIWLSEDACFVECVDGRLMIVAPFYKVDYDSSAHKNLGMVELDVIKGTFRDMKSLGFKANSVFFGKNGGFCVDATRFPGIIKPNHIYLNNGSHQEATTKFNGRFGADAGKFCHASDHSGFFNDIGTWVIPNF